MKGAAWAAPAIVVAAAAPLAAASSSPTTTPTFDASQGCATVGATGHGCAGTGKTAQVPFTIKNTTGSTLFFQVLGTKSWISGGTEPSSWNTYNSATPFSVWKNNGTQNNCTPPYSGTKTCGGSTYLSIPVASGQTMSLWLVDTSLGSSSAFYMKAQYRWVDANCNVVVPTAVVSSGLIISSNNCA